jgi:UDP-N-acetylglucosamine 2-epimerase (non-hydrolysing)
MKVITILGTRPEIIRLSLIIKKLDEFCDKHILVHTGQNFTKNLSDIFFEELDIRKPDYHLFNYKNTLGNQLATLFKELEQIIQDEKPEQALVLGDTNSALSAVLLERMGVPVVHMEAGNRCYDLAVPEEKNRRVIDAISTFNLPYTPNSRENLLREGIPNNRIMVSGNPIYEVLVHYQSKINESHIRTKLHLQEKDYFLVTCHRAENVDNATNLTEILNGINAVAEHFDKRVICSIHPRTKSKLNNLQNNKLHPLVEFHEPFGFFDFIQLQKHALCVMTDSGTVQEESCIFHVPAVTIRNSTERPETVACGSNIVSGVDATSILRAVKVMVDRQPKWVLPTGYDDNYVSDKVVKFILGGKGVV